MISKIITFSVLFGICAPSLAQILRTSVTSGNWSNKNTWDCGCVPSSSDHAKISTGHIVTLVSTNTITNLTIESGATLTDHGLPNTISGNLVVEGTYSGSGDILLTGVNTTWDGGGTISNTAGIQVTGNKTILSYANLTINSSTVAIQGSYTITNQGTLTVGGNITGTSVASVWVNDVNATLNIGGSSGVPLLSTGTLHASAVGNTVNYYAAYAHTLNLPAAVSGYNTYHHLKISGSNTKTLPNGDVAVNGDLTINSTFNGSGSLKKLFLRGNWINNGNFTEGTGLGTVTFDGTTDQYITRASTENLNVLVVNKSSGNVIMNTSLIAERGLTMMAGNIDMQGNKLTLGLSAAITGTLSWITGTIIGKFERWISSAGTPILFPIGTAVHYRPATIQFNALTPGSLIAEFISSSPGNNGLPLTENSITLYNTFRDGYWSLTAANSLDTVNVNLDLTANGFTGFSVNDNTRLLSRTAPANPWTLQGVHLARSGNTIKRTGMTTLSGNYGLGDDTNCTAPTAPAITGVVEVCVNTPGVVYSVIDHAPNTYTWRVAGGTITSGNSTHSITVDWGAVGMTGKVSVVEKNTCTESEEISVNVPVHALPVMAITGKSNVPENGASPETYSISATANYTYPWQVTGGIIASGQGTNVITVNWGNAGPGSVCVTGNHAPSLPAVSCGQSLSSCNTIAVYRVINSLRSGNWTTPVNWDCTCVPAAADNVTVRNTHTISLTTARTVNHVNINPGGTINTNSNTLTIGGDLAVNGTLSGTGSLVLTGINTVLDGIGTIAHSGVMTMAGMKTILSTATLTKNAGSITLASGVIVTNNGRITLGGTLTGVDANGQWINAANATLNTAGDLMPVGKLMASASGNTVRFFGGGAQVIPLPTAGQYANLIISDAGIKTAPAGVMWVSGNFTNNGNFQHNGGTIEFNGNSQVAGSAITTFNHLSLAASGTLTFPSGLVNIAGNLAFASGSTFDPALGTIALTGGSPQSISPQGASINNLTVMKTAGVVNITSPMTMLRLLHVQSPTVVNANANLIITSRGNTTDQDASIGTIPPGASVNGVVKVERYMQAVGNNNRYLSAPVLAPIPNVQLSDDFTVKQGSIWYYDEPVAGVSNNGWYNPPVASPLQSGRGFLAWMYDGSNAITWDVDGMIHQGPIALPMSYTATSGGVAYDGWNLVGNPYPSSIAWNDDPAAWVRSAGISPIAYVPDLQSNVFRIYNHADNSGDLNAGIIAMGQAFWVKANQPSPSITINEGAKINGTTGKFYRSTPEAPAQLKIQITNSTLSDETYLKINPAATTGFDHLFDGHKLKNERVNIYFIDASDRQLAMHTLPKIGREEVVRMGVEVKQSGSYQLSFSGLNHLPEGQWYLVDQFERQHWPISEGGSYEVELPMVDKALNNRFYLTASKGDFQESLQDQIKLFPNPVRDVVQIHLPQSSTSTLTVLDPLGNIHWIGTGSSLVTLDISHFPAGLYLLKIELGNEIATTRILKD